MTTVYGGANAKGLPAAGASTPTAGAMMPSSQTVPPYFSAEDDENLLMAKVLGGPRAVADAIQRTPGHTYRTEQAKKVVQTHGMEIRHQYAAYDKAERLLGWRPTHDFVAGIRKTIPWYRKYIESTLKSKIRDVKKQSRKAVRK
jgi:dTDP-D-glucose 4,6-dehydratase